MSQPSALYSDVHNIVDRSRWKIAFDSTFWANHVYEQFSQFRVVAISRSRNTVLALLFLFV